jgi:hypothetical protein
MGREEKDIMQKERDQHFDVLIERPTRNRVEMHQVFKVGDFTPLPCPCATARRPRGERKKWMRTFEECFRGVRFSKKVTNQERTSEELRTTWVTIISSINRGENMKKKKLKKTKRRRKKQRERQKNSKTSKIHISMPYIFL